VQTRVPTPPGGYFLEYLTQMEDIFKMKRIRSLFLGLVIMLIGCTQNRNVRSSTDYVALTEKSQRQQAIVTFRDQKKMIAKKVRFAPDSTTWVMPVTHKLISIQTTDVSEVRFTKRVKGALQGAGFGLLGGALFGVVAGLSSDEGGFFTPNELAVIGGVYFAALGGIIGLPVGALIGSKEVYHIQADQTKSTAKQ